MKHRISYRVCAVFLALILLTFPAQAAFSDVSGESWYAASVAYVDSHGLFEGTTHTKFSPDDPMTRGMFVTVLCRMSRENTRSFPAAGFADVPEDAYCASAVNWAVQAGIVSGVSDTSFAPDDPITREQICTMLERYSRYRLFSFVQDKDPVTFTDEAEISAYAAYPVALCQRAGLIDGYDDGAFRPGACATRCEVAAIIARMGQLMEDVGYLVGPGKTEDWNLMLVNPWHSIPAGYVDTLTLKSVSYDRSVDARIYDDLMDMLSAMKSAGLSPYINSAYRTNSYQQYLFQNQISKYLGYGYSYARARELAQTWVALPGTSEHELGLAVDLNMGDSGATYRWLADNSWKYGFICRYPADKVAITGIQPEPWHYRYVGKEAAKEIFDSGLCLEEYLAE